MSTYEVMLRIGSTHFNRTSESKIADHSILNPKAHETVEQKDVMRAIEYLVFASLLAKRVDEPARRTV